MPENNGLFKKIKHTIQKMLKKKREAKLENIYTSLGDSDYSKAIRSMDNIRRQYAPKVSMYENFLRKNGLNTK
jgi:hypothetical protein